MDNSSFPYPKKLYQPLGQCAYCQETNGLSTEHIIPFGLGSELILPKSSCEKHRKATSRVEDFVLRKYLGVLRSHLNLPSRKPHLRPTGYRLTLRRGIRRWERRVDLQDHPGFVRFMIFEPPGCVVGRPVLQETFSLRAIDAEIFPDIRSRLARLDADGFEDKVAINAMDLSRMIAKIGHAYAIAEKGVSAFDEMYVAHLIDGESPDWNYRVGGYDFGSDQRAETLHTLKLLRRGQDLSVLVHLFVPYCPRWGYEVVVGRLRQQYQ